MRQFVAWLLVLCVSGLPHTRAQSTNNPARQWSAVTGLKNGEKLGIQLKDGRKLEGVLLDSTESGLKIVNKVNTVSIDRAEIRKLYVVRGRSTSTKVAIGAGVGAGAGAITGVAVTDDAWFRGPAILVITALGTVIGIVTGWVVGRTHGNRLLIYEGA